MQQSGNAYKVRLAFNQLEIPFTLVNVDILRGENRTPDFLRKNPEGRIPLLEMRGRGYLAESNAILCFIAEATALFPDGRWERAEVLRWMFFEQNSHETYLAQPRFWLSIRGGADLRRDHFDDWMERGYAALMSMERHLATAAWFAAGRYTIADIALFAHTHVAGEGGFDLATFPNVLAWLDRVKAQPRHIGIDWVAEPP
ncbi:GST-like protein yfcG [Blastochloris viridis]|nr:GST-like protein yfcG [Blastochloris viridis]